MRFLGSHSFLYPFPSQRKLISSSLNRGCNLVSSARLPRKLAAILYADVAGYSGPTGEDEDAAHRRLSEYLDFNLHHGGGSPRLRDELGRRCGARQL